MPELANEFSWSKSRHEKFEECLRSYFYQYYGSWGGWAAPAGSPVRELYVLKKLSSRWQWAGSVVHEALKDLLARARATSRFRELDQLLERARQRARAQWTASRDKSYWRESSRIVGLVEHEYAEPVIDAEWKRIWDQVIEGSLRAFYASPTFERIRRIPSDRWLTVDELDSWTFEGTKIWVAIDFAYVDDDGTYQILDWKTGREREVDHGQIGIYASYARQKWGVEPERLAGGLVYLSTPAGDRVDVEADRDSLEACQAAMRESIAAMRARLVDPSTNSAHQDQFPQLLDRSRCARCQFRRPCGRM